MKLTAKQLGDLGERHVAQSIRCPRCKSSQRTLRLLPPNFRCADLICDFCGYLAQVKTTAQRTLTPPSRIIGAAWAPQKARMEAGIYFSLFVVVVRSDDAKDRRVYFLPAELQTPEMFAPRKPLGPSAKRAGWQGYMIELEAALGPMVPLDGRLGSADAAMPMGDELPLDSVPDTVEM